MGILRKEDTSWACPSTMTDEHGLVEADWPRGKEYRSPVVITYLYPMMNFPKIINIGWVVSVSEPKFTIDGIKAAFRNEFPQEIGEWICLFIKGVGTPKPLHIPSKTGGH